MNNSPLAPATPPSSASWHHVLALFVTSRLLLYGAAIVLPYFFQAGAFSHGLAHEASSADYWSRWDSNWFSAIAVDGYDYRADAASSVAFFPLLPLLIRACCWAGIPAWIAGLLIANACTLALLWIFHQWMRREFANPVIAETATALLAFCPQGCWFILGYSEPLYLLTAVGALASARNGRWWAACLWAIAHGLTRSNGITLVLPLLCLSTPAMIAAIRGRSLPKLLQLGLATIGAWIGHGAYLLFLWGKFGTWQANQITSMAGWGVSLAIDGRHLTQKIPGIGFQLFTHTFRQEWIAWSWAIATTATLFALAVFVGRRLPLFWSACLVAFWSLFLLTAECGWLTGSMGRFAAALFPVAVAQALFVEKNRWAQPMFLVFNAGAAFTNIALVFSGYHIV